MSETGMADVMRHATAWPGCHRNHFCASHGHRDWRALMDAVKRGLMTQEPPTEWVPYWTFRVTDDGMDYLRKADEEGDQ